LLEEVCGAVRAAVAGATGKAGAGAGAGAASAGATAAGRFSLIFPTLEYCGRWKGSGMSDINLANVVYIKL
jgi:hypothetical protein